MNTTLRLLLGFSFALALAACKDDPVYWYPTDGDTTEGDTTGGGTDTGGGSGDITEGDTDPGTDSGDTTDSGDLEDTEPDTDTGDTEDGSGGGEEEELPPYQGDFGHETEFFYFLRITPDRITMGWNYPYEFEIGSWNNEEEWIVVKNLDDGYPFNAGFWYRFDWIPVDADSFFLCGSYVGHETEAEAAAGERPNHWDPVGGCFGKPWLAYSRGQGPIAIGGWMTDEEGVSHSIQEDVWKMGSAAYHFVEYNNYEGWVVVRADDRNAEDAGTWGRVEWLNLEGEDYWCFSTHGKSTLAQAIASPLADRSNIATGCFGSKWLILIYH